MMKAIRIGNINIDIKSNLTIIAGPCAIESEEHAIRMAGLIKQITDKLNIQLIFKSCYSKDYRASIDSFHGIGLESGLSILNKIKEEYSIPITTDVSNVSHMKQVSEVVDLIQIPAYLSKQTSILMSAARTGKPVNVKKGQHVSPYEMLQSAKKLQTNGCENIILTERGTFFGYDNLVSDMRNIQIMKKSGFPVCYDATHSVQRPNLECGYSGGNREFIPYLTRAAISAGANLLFMEVHDNPSNALCDSKTQLPINKLEEILIQAKKVYELMQSLDDIEVE